MTTKRKPLSSELLAEMRKMLDLAILAGCTANEVEALAETTIRCWVDQNKGPTFADGSR